MLGSNRLTAIIAPQQKQCVVFFRNCSWPITFTFAFIERIFPDMGGHQQQRADRLVNDILDHGMYICEVLHYMARRYILQNRRIQTKITVI